HLGRELLHLVLEVEHALDHGERHALAREARDLAQLHDVARRVAPGSAARAAGHDEPDAVVLPQRLRMQPRELARGRDREDRIAFGHALGKLHLTTPYKNGAA